jgi:hypothetical protein
VAAILERLQQAPEVRRLTRPRSGPACPRRGLSS